MSPVFAALVLRYILKKVEQGMFQYIDVGNSFGDAHDDGMGCILIVLAYVDDVNCLLHLQDFKPFLGSFKPQEASWSSHEHRNCLTIKAVEHLNSFSSINHNITGASL